MLEPQYPVRFHCHATHDTVVTVNGPSVDLFRLIPFVNGIANSGSKGVRF